MVASGMAQLAQQTRSEAHVQVEHYRKVVTAAEANGAYKGLPIFALPELHEVVGAKAGEYFPAQARVLELAAGSGAMTRRLLDQGFKVEAADVVPENFRLHGEAPFHALDLNQDFAGALTQRYPGLVALEIIEHLENPRHFLRQCALALEPGGVLVLSTPNIDTPRSVLRFITHGHFRQFGDEDYRVSGHITPISQWQMEKMIAEQGWDVLEWTSCGVAYGKGMRHLSAKLLALLMGRNPRTKGAITLLVLRKKI